MCTSLYTCNTHYHRGYHSTCKLLFHIQAGAKQKASLAYTGSGCTCLLKSCWHALKSGTCQLYIRCRHAASCSPASGQAQAH
jgi:hypothetical protein